MTIAQLDRAFPFLVFAYGLLLTVVLNHPKLIRLAEERLSSELRSSFQAKRMLAYICFFVGGLWSLQNIWFS